MCRMCNVYVIGIMLMTLPAFLEQLIAPYVILFYNILINLH